MGIIPDFLLSSPANRALTTAKVISREIGYGMDIVTDRRIYMAGEQTLLSVLNEQSDHQSLIMMFGHNPGFTDFANELANEHIDNIPTCGVCQIDFAAQDWSKVSFGSGKMIFFQYPKGLS